MESTMAPRIQAQKREFALVGEWRDFINENFPWLEISACNKQFHAAASARSFDHVLLVDIDTGLTKARRTKQLANRAEAGYIKIFWQLSGMVELTQDKRRILLKPGCASVCDVARPYDLRVSDDAHFEVMLLPYQACPGWEDISQRVCATPVPDQITTHAALGCLNSLLHAPLDAEPDATKQVLRSLQWMLSTSLHRSAAGASGEGERPGEATFNLTDKETLILAELANGLSNKQIAQCVYVSANTIKFHLKNIYQKLGVVSRVQAANVARKILG